MCIYEADVLSQLEYAYELAKIIHEVQDKFQDNDSELQNAQKEELKNGTGNKYQVILHNDKMHDYREVCFEAYEMIDVVEQYLISASCL